MKLIITGPRDLYPDDETINRALGKVFKGCGLLPTQIITGGGPGVDACARRYALLPNRGISAWEFEEDRKKYGKSAEAIRDSRMLDHGDALLVFTRHWLGTRRGKSLLEMAGKREMPVYVEEVAG